MSHPRVSVQVQLLSGNDAYKKVFLRISTDGMALVLTRPMSPYMARSDFAFSSFILAERKGCLSDQELHYHKVLLKHLPKCTAHMVAVSKVKGRSMTDGFFCEKRIPLPRKVRHSFATVEDGDELFQGKKFIQYPDGSVFLHVELIAESKDNYIPEERMLDPKVVKTPVTDGPTAILMETNTARILVLPEDQAEDKQPAKRKRVQAESSVANDDDDDDDGNWGEDAEMHSQVTVPLASAQAAAATVAEAQAEKFAEEARDKAASVLQQAVEQGKKAVTLGGNGN